MVCFTHLLAIVPNTNNVKEEVGFYTHFLTLKIISKMEADMKAMLYVLRKTA